jgi:hypothetical protein
MQRPVVGVAYIDLADRIPWSSTYKAPKEIQLAEHADQAAGASTDITTDIRLTGLTVTYPGVSPLALSPSVSYPRRSSSPSTPTRPPVRASTDITLTKD